MGWGSFQYNQQKSKSEQSSGLLPNQRAWFSSQAPGLFNKSQTFADKAAADPGGLEYRGVVDELLPMGKYGLARGSEEGVYQLGRDLFTQASGSRARRGFVSPHNLEGVLGDSLRMASGALIPQSTQLALQRAQMAPALRQASFGYQMTPMQTIQNLLASTGSGTSSGSGFGFQVAGGSAGTSSSDRRLKSNITRIGTHPLGIGWYRYIINNHSEEGVMADEVLTVRPDAVATDANGYYMVDYSLIGRAV